MHEVGITTNLIEIAETHAREAGFTRILSINVDIGDMSGVIPEAVEFCFEAVSNETMAKGATLVINRIAGRMKCEECQHAFPADNLTFECPECGSFILTTLQGNELRITEMEIE